MKRQYIYILLLLLLTLGSCSKGYLEVNTDPNNPTSATPNLVLPSAEASIAGCVGGDYAILGGFWSQYWTQCAGSNQYKNIDGYQLLTSFDQQDWSEIYANAFHNLAYVKSASLQQNLNPYYFMATVMECYGYELMVDLYDQIPFNNAVQGGSGNFQPTYDPSVLVYDSIAKRLERLSSLNISTPLTSAQISQDLIFGQNGTTYAVQMKEWQSFANTLLLKIYLRQMYIRPDTASNGILRLVNRMNASGQSFLTTTAGLGGFKDVVGQANPLYDINNLTTNFTGNLRTSKTIYNYLQTNNDPRLSSIAGPGPNGNPTGAIPEIQGGVNVTYYGQAVVLANTSVSVTNATDTVYFISLPESYFLQAEAVAAGYITTGNAATLFQQGINASYSKYGLVYNNSYTYPTGGTFEQQQQAIIMQKWVSMANSEGIEAFFETNRTGYPTIYPGTLNPQTVTDTTLQNWTGGQLTYSLIGATTNSMFPKRLPFTEIEYSTNANTPSLVPITTKVWWDVKPSK